MFSKANETQLFDIDVQNPLEFALFITEHPGLLGRMSKVHMDLRPLISTIHLHRTADVLPVLPDLDKYIQEVEKLEQRYSSFKESWKENSDNVKQTAKQWIHLFSRLAADSSNNIRALRVIFDNGCIALCNHPLSCYKPFLKGLATVKVKGRVTFAVHYAESGAAFLEEKTGMKVTRERTMKDSWLKFYHHEKRVQTVPSVGSE